MAFQTARCNPADTGARTPAHEYTPATWYPLRTAAARDDAAGGTVHR
jgi:hypothetical protein